MSALRAASFQLTSLFEYSWNKQTQQILTMSRMLQPAMSTIDPPPARVFAQRVLELKEQGVDGKAAISAADEEYKAERKAKRAAYARLKEIARLQGKEPPARPYPKSKRETLAEERWHSRKPRIFEIVRRLKDEMTADTNERFNRGY
ncbi:unnamed protein product [Linum tenue]|uniref:Uncharacterized protein n=1 Tax=Linum tenue TaxID=586396 RepID=A0AAV0IAU6_9ROSI|nr:unnamed protein product [Linum tenue]